MSERRLKLVKKLTAIKIFAEWSARADCFSLLKSIIQQFCRFDTKHYSKVFLMGYRVGILWVIYRYIVGGLYSSSI